MSLQTNYVLISADADQRLKVQAFTEQGDAYTAMETEHNEFKSKMDKDEVGYENFIEKDCAQISNLYGDSIQWIIEKTFVQTPKMAAVCRRYDKMILEAEKDSISLNVCKSSEFHAPGIEANINAFYDGDKKILYYAVSHMPFADDKEFIPFDAYKWCVKRGIHKVSDIEKAYRVLAAIDSNATFGNEY